MNVINNIVKNARFKVIARHVYGYQDDLCMYGKLDWWGKRNVDIDHLAKSLMFEKRRLKLMNNKVALSKYENFAVAISTLKVTGDYVNSIHDIIHGHWIMKYWNE